MTAFTTLFSFLWKPALLSHGVCPTKIEFFEGGGDMWTCISPDLSTNPGPERQGNVPVGTITDISESALNRGLLYAGTDDGQLHVTKDDGCDGGPRHA